MSLARRPRYRRCSQNRGTHLENPRPVSQSSSGRCRAPQTGGAGASPLHWFLAGAAPWRRGVHVQPGPRGHTSETAAGGPAFTSAQCRAGAGRAVFLTSRELQESSRGDSRTGSQKTQAKARVAGSTAVGLRPLLKVSCPWALRGPARRCGPRGLQSSSTANPPPAPAWRIWSVLVTAASVVAGVLSPLGLATTGLPPPC